MILPFAVCIALTAMSPRLTAAAGEELVFERDVRKILKAQCFHCHGEEDSIEGGLDLRQVRLMLSGGDSGPAIEAGNSEQSWLIERVESGEMPPGEKSLSSSEIETLRRWIDQGARTLHEEGAEPELFTVEEREFWSFQPSRWSNPQRSAFSDRQVNAIDTWIEAALKEHNLSPSNAATKSQLIRRLTFDLHGLPPTPEDVEAFVADQRPDAYERLVDRLLASPRFGEAWGRHWLDVAGYADSEGYVDSDPPREWAYRYRDYVIDAWNRDEGLDEFIREQLAGDELVPQPFQHLTQESVRRLTATGYLRMAPDGTVSGGGDQNVARNEVMAETINIVSTSLLGLTVGCARCHNHRYDPITQEDYYRFRAIFEPALSWKQWRTRDQRKISLYTDHERQLADKIEAEAQAKVDARKTRQQQHIDRTLAEELVKAPEERQEELKLAFETPSGERDESQTALLKEYPNIGNINPGSLYLYAEQRNRRADEIKAVADRLENELRDRWIQNEIAQFDAELQTKLASILEIPIETRSDEQNEMLKSYELFDVDFETISEVDPKASERINAIRSMAETCRNSDAKTELAELQKEIDALRGTKPKEHFVRALTEPIDFRPETRLFIRGNHNQPGEVVAPGELEILTQHHSFELPTLPDVKTTGRRLNYARHLTSGQHPLVARVQVNRFWLHLFRRGLVETPGDFGVLGSFPSHPELLDNLSIDLVDRGWQTKRIVRQMVRSATYQQDSARSMQVDEQDPDNRWLSRQTMRRLTSEEVRDSIIHSTGLMSFKMFGAPVPVREDEVGQIVLGIENLDGERKPQPGADLGSELHRRSIYVEARRSRPLAVLETFDLPSQSPNCTQRASSNVAPQSLLMLNSQFLAGYAHQLAERVLQQHPDRLEDQITLAWTICHGTSPKPEMIERLTRYVEDQAATFEEGGAANAEGPTSKRRALDTMCQAILASNPFLYVD